MEKVTINIQDIISNPDYNPDAHINYLKSKHPELSTEELEELAIAHTKQTYEHYSNSRINKSKSADLILEKIKCGHIPTKYEIFELTCDDPVKIEEYVKLETIKDRVTDSGTISKEDFYTLSSIIGFDEEISQQIMQGFVAKGILVERYAEKESEIKK